MAGYENRLDLVDEPANPLQVLAVHARNAADGKPNAVQREGVPLCDVKEQLPRVGVREEVLRMNLEPRRGGGAGRHFRQMR